MLKKTIPFVLISAFALGACGNEKAIPSNNETPMEELHDQERNWEPNVQDEQRGGADLDGLENDPNVNDGVNNGVHDGVIKDDELRDDNDNMLRDEEKLDNR